MYEAMRMLEEHWQRRVRNREISDSFEYNDGYEDGFLEAMDVLGRHLREQAAHEGDMR